MSLLTRLLSPTEDEEKIPVHQFMAALAEYKRGFITPIQIKNAFNLSDSEATNLNEFISNLDSETITREMIHDILMLGEAEYYPLNTVKSRLGLNEE